MTTTKKKHYASLQAYLTGPPRVTQRDLARRAELNQSAISMILRGKRLPSGPMAMRLSQLTGVPVAAFFARKRPKQTKNGRSHGDD